ncbi:MAG: helix-turn-helix transcriptional regulator [Planctomycetota bacterium]
MTRPHPSRDSVTSSYGPSPDALELATYDLAGLATGAALCATLVRDARRSAGISMAELGQRTGVPEQIVALWEDPTWEGHSLNILRRVAKALELRVELRLAPAARPRRTVSVDEAVAA